MASLLGLEVAAHHVSRRLPPYCPNHVLATAGGAPCLAYLPLPPYDAFSLGSGSSPESSKLMPRAPF
jgi:hypothetical protein